MRRPKNVSAANANPFAPAAPVRVKRPIVRPKTTRPSANARKLRADRAKNVPTANAFPVRSATNAAVRARKSSYRAANAAAPLRQLAPRVSTKRTIVRAATAQRTTPTTDAAVSLLWFPTARAAVIAKKRPATRAIRSAHRPADAFRARTTRRVSIRAKTEHQTARAAVRRMFARMTMIATRDITVKIRLRPVRNVNQPFVPKTNTLTVQRADIAHRITVRA